MSSNVILGVRVIKNQYQRIKIDNVDLDAKVDVLREIASQKINKSKNELLLLYAGVEMEDDSAISAYGVKSGVTVHVLEKINPPIPHIPKPLKEPEIIKLVSTVDEFGYKNALQKLSRPEILQKILEAAPALSEDLAALAILQDPELLVNLTDPDVLRRVMEAHPVLAESLPQIIGFIKDNANTMAQHQAGTSSGYSYSLDALSDDDDMESNDAREGNPLTRNPSYNAITAAQLAAAIANATTNFSSTGAILNNSNGNQSSNVITNEMFGNALQQAFANSQGISSGVLPGAAVGEESMESIRTRLQMQLQQMREMGLVNENLNIRALQATSGDVQAAIELVFNGVID